MTSNPDFPIEVGFRSRIIYIVYTPDDKYWNEEQRKEFDAFIHKGKKHLRTLGDFTAKNIINNPGTLLRKNPEECNWKVTAQTILEEFYKAGKCEIALWTNLFVSETDVTATAAEDAAEANYFELRGFFISTVNEKFRIDPKRDSAWGYVKECTFPDKLDHCLIYNLVPFLRRRVKKDEEGHFMSNEIIITRDIVKELRRARIVNITTMPALAREIPNFSYDKLRLGEDTKRVVYGSENDFLNFLNCADCDAVAAAEEGKN